MTNLNILNPAKIARGASQRLARYVPTKPFRMRNAGPIVSFTFDDIPETAAIHGAAALERSGVRGTFYIAGGLCGGRENDCPIVTVEQAQRLHAAGHEIGCHTFSHINVRMVGAEVLRRECERNRAFFDMHLPNLRLENFAYPYGVVAIRSKLLLQKQFVSCRGIMPGLNAGSIDLGHVRAVEIYDRTIDWTVISRILAETVRRNGWLVFYTHDVQQCPTWIGCTPGLLEQVVARSMEAGCEVVTMAEGMRRIGWR